MKITIATSIKYGNYKVHRPAADRAIKALKALTPLFKRHFDYRTNVEVKFRPIRGSVVGRANNTGNWIEIDPRRSLSLIIKTIAHELTHSEQYKQERLTWEMDKNCWDGKLYKKASTHKAYLALPWEVEARARADEFVADEEVKSIIQEL